MKQRPMLIHYHNRNKCSQCRRPESFCLCSTLSPVQTKTRFIILMHPMEAKKEKLGTGRLTHLQLTNSEIIVDIDFTENKRLNDIIQKNHCAILYPNNQSINISKDCSHLKNQSKHHVIILLDGTWPCAKKMYKQSKNLHALPAISFDNESTSQFLIKQQPHPHCLSTIESTLKVINILKNNNIENCSTEKFLLPFEKMIQLQIDCIKNPPSHSYRAAKKDSVSKKHHYKDQKARTSFYNA